ncbi:hypothetical protein BU14_0643s0001 [Porphyra umbilicalis]|uniref:Uncharacterized protein n=1 Tax=Porphyra umbilicalis TaxID=2786 RepID=A0A1X6NR54_PORUM|nr:hypothetical protein BU14_0643s0001 [Porphyra umbilicalis]|eukprot:OSX70883.1 hypothetical protein BU14_0643s0001 [Porphyra umbilicalis]
MHRLCLAARPSLVVASARKAAPLELLFRGTPLSTSAAAGAPAGNGDSSVGGNGGSGGGGGGRGNAGGGDASSNCSDRVSPPPPPPPPPALSPFDCLCLGRPARLPRRPRHWRRRRRRRRRRIPHPPRPPPIPATDPAAVATAWSADGSTDAPAPRRWNGGGQRGGGFGRPPAGGGGGGGGLPDDPMFSHVATAGIPDAEVRRMAAIYRLVREHADAAAGTGPPVDAEANVLLGPRLSPIRSLPRVAPAVLAELRHQLPAADAADVLVSSGSAAAPTVAAAAAAAAGGDGRAAAEAALWRRVDAATMDPHSFARLVRASALGPGGAAGAAGAAAAAAAAPGGAPGGRRRRALAALPGRPLPAGPAAASAPAAAPAAPAPPRARRAPSLTPAGGWRWITGRSSCSAPLSTRAAACSGGGPTGRRPRRSGGCLGRLRRRGRWRSSTRPCKRRLRMQRRGWWGGGGGGRLLGRSDLGRASVWGAAGFVGGGVALWVAMRGGRRVPPPMAAPST